MASKAFNLSQNSRPKHARAPKKSLAVRDGSNSMRAKARQPLQNEGPPTQHAGEQTAKPAKPVSRRSIDKSMPHSVQTQITAPGPAFQEGMECMQQIYLSWHYVLEPQFSRRNAACKAMHVKALLALLLTSTCILSLCLVFAPASEELHRERCGPKLALMKSQSAHLTLQNVVAHDQHSAPGGQQACPHERNGLSLRYFGRSPMSSYVKGGQPWVALTCF